MHADTDQHTREDIQQVAKGLTAVVGVDEASVQLKRLYGRARAVDALVALVDVAGGAEQTGNQPTVPALVVGGRRGWDVSPAPRAAWRAAA